MVHPARIQTSRSTSNICYCLWAIVVLFCFLALLDYVSRAHEIKIRPSSVVCRTSYVIRRPSVASIISEVTAWIAFKFQLWLPLGHMPRR